MNSQVLVLYRETERVPPYRDALEAAGLTACLVEAGASFSLDNCHGLLLTGGIDIDPALYGEQPHEQTNPPDITLDTAEMNALSEALERDLPVLAICRGMQLLNVHHGGSLVQHLLPVENHRIVPQQDRSLPVHSVTIEQNSLLHRIAGAESWNVNSRHHQAVKTRGSGLHISAIRPDDGVVEALERPDRTFVVGVQWHPEDQIHRDATQLQLFTAFAAAMQA